jgi:acyl-CoA reductase-like NAD-dependent aldehyde dehydrogenase
MTEYFKLMVPGAVSAGTLEVTAAYNGSPITTIELGDADAVNKALTTAHGLYRDRDTWLPKHQRIAILERAAGLLDGRIDELALAAAREGGKPLADSKVELVRAVDGLRGCVECLRTESGSTIPMGINPASAGRLAFTGLEPIGVVVAVSAFNHPMNLIIHQIGPAIAAGCPVIVKPAEDTPLSCLRLVQILREAGLPDGWCQAINTTDLDVAEMLVTDSRVGFFSFIGSAKVGWMLRSKFAPGTRCALPFSFQAAVFTRDLDCALRVWKRLDASAVMVNDHTAFRVDWMPFAGLRQSGFGVGGIPYSFREMSVEKMLVIRSAEL